VIRGQSSVPHTPSIHSRPTRAAPCSSSSSSSSSSRVSLNDEGDVLSAPHSIHPQPANQRNTLQQQQQQQHVLATMQHQQQGPSV
jgi:hypothetical protein